MYVALTVLIVKMVIVKFVDLDMILEILLLVTMEEYYLLLFLDNQINMKIFLTDLKFSLKVREDSGPLLCKRKGKDARRTPHLRVGGKECGSVLVP